MDAVITSFFISFKNTSSECISKSSQAVGPVNFRFKHLSKYVFEGYKRPGDDHIHVTEIFFQNFYPSHSDKR